MASKRFLPCAVEFVQNLAVELCDAICIVEKDAIAELRDHFALARKLDQSFDSEVSCFAVNGFKCPIIYSPIGELNDYDDVRNYSKAGLKAIQRAVKAGAKAPLLVLPKPSKEYKNAELLTALGALEYVYVPIQYREDVPEKKERIQTLWIYSPDINVITKISSEVILLESGRFIARDIGVGDPERMAPSGVLEYVKNSFTSGVIKVNVISDANVFKKEYPLFQAVNRAAGTIERHKGHIIFLEYNPSEPATKTLMLVGKGVTYDTGGADIKYGGVMAGMSRDKCGAAAVAGFMKIVEQMKPAGIHVISALCMVRNSVGEECYVADEIITSRAGARVRVGNTDAEGRMCMADALCKMKEMAYTLPDPHLFTIATLTGHACLAVGNYSIIMDNGPARKSNHGVQLQKIGEEFGDPLEISIIRQEDFAFHKGKVHGEDIIQCNNAPSSRTPRGHQTPAAFLMLATGLDAHGTNSLKPIKYTHLDIAGSAGDYPEMPTGSPIIALAKMHLK